MAFARLGPNSAVYVFESAAGIHCHWCAFGNRDALAMSRLRAALHVARHRAAWHKVPKGVERRILTECRS